MEKRSQKKTLQMWSVVFDKGAKAIQWEKKIIFLSVSSETTVCTCKKKKKNWCWTLTFCHIWKLTQNEKPERKQDGRVEGHGAYLFPQIHQKYIYIWSNSHWIPTECRQKISYNPSCKKDQRIKWEKKMVIEMRPMPLGGNYEKGMVPSPWEPPSSSEKSAGTDRELQKLRGECTSRLVSDRAEKDQHRWSLPTCYTSEPKSCPCWCVQW